MRTQTNYKALNNRCHNCGHRKVMVDGNGACTVITAPHQPDKEVVCPCLKHR